MNKELEVVKKLQHCGVEEYREALEKVEKILLEYGQIKNAKPSEALEIVDKMTNYILLDEEYGFITGEEKQSIINDRDTIKQSLIKAQEQEKILEIIVNKRVEMTLLLYSFTESKDVEFYNLRISGRLTKDLTQEEYDVLKEVLKDE